MTGKAGMKHDPAEVKLVVMRLFYEEGRTQVQVTAALGIRDPPRIQAWLRQYRAEGASTFAKPVGCQGTVTPGGG